MSLRGWLAIAAAVTALAPCGGAQTVVVRGEAYDSLRGAPLRQASISVVGTDVRTTTDDLGRFAIEGVPRGVHVFTAQHVALDSIGLSGLTTRVMIGDGDTPVRLAIPSFATFWRAACGATPVPPEGGFVYGTVRDAAHLDPVNGAVVELSWLDIATTKKAGISQRRWRGQAQTDTTGSYTICGIPAQDGLRMQATADSGASGIVNVFPSPWRVQRRDLLLGPAKDDDVTRRATITGRVTDERGTPFPNARVFVDEFGEMRSGGDGTVILRNVPAGTRQLEVLAIGRIPVTMILELGAGDTATFVAAMRAVTTLDVVRVLGDRRQRRTLEDFETRRRDGSGFIIDSTVLTSRGRLASAFQDFPSVEVITRGSQFTMSLPGDGGSRCAPIIFIDGRQTDIDELNMLRITEIAAVEVYPRRMSAPAEFVSRERCGSVVVWTRWAFS